MLPRSKAYSIRLYDLLQPVFSDFLFLSVFPLYAKLILYDEVMVKIFTFHDATVLNGITLCTSASEYNQLYLQETVANIMRERI